jgi:hypothetical protein
MARARTLSWLFKPAQRLSFESTGRSAFFCVSSVFWQIELVFKHHLVASACRDGGERRIRLGKNKLKSRPARLWTVRTERA